MIKLAILGTRGIPARYGGFETFAEQISPRLVARGIDVTVFCPSAIARADEMYRGVRLRYVKSASLGKFSEMFWDARCFWSARKHFDLVYMLGVGAGFAAWVPRIFGDAKVWVNSDGLEWKRKKYTWLQRAYLVVAEALSAIFATRIIADASAIETYLRARYPFCKRISAIAYGADISENIPNKYDIEKWALLPDCYYIVVCRLEPENHVLEIIEGFKQSKSELPLVILGNVENPTAYVQRLLAHSDERVRFIGTVFDKEKLTALRFYARAYLHGHSVGGTNPSLLEAMACSNLIIAHDNAFNREVLGKAGLYFSTWSGVVNAINEIDKGNVDRYSLRRSAVDRIRLVYQWEQIADKYVTLLRNEIL